MTYGVWSESQQTFVAGPFASRRMARYAWRQLVASGSVSQDLVIFPYDVAPEVAR